MKAERTEKGNNSRTINKTSSYRGYAWRGGGMKGMQWRALTYLRPPATHTVSSYAYGGQNEP